ncbi:MAG: DUF4136 domain-containing protein [Pseudomonadota bacterium]|uniref:DUF4136 domain-containing protein n=1 Tax=Caldimonas aquatica TaxID=376175 RepID=UPI00347228B3
MDTIKRWGTAACLAAAVVLAGCATPRLIESDVTSYTQWPEQRRPGTFTFERLPSQQARPEEQARIEALALPALQQLGFRLVPESAQPDVTIQVGVSRTRYDRAPWDDPWPYGYAGWGFGHRFALGVGLGWQIPSPYYVFQVAVLIRDAKTKQVLYETSARHDGRWTDEGLQAALFEAALKDFPRPALSPRRVRIEIPRDGSAPAAAASAPQPGAPAGSPAR